MNIWSWLLILALIISITLVACGGDNNSNSSEGKTTPAIVPMVEMWCAAELPVTGNSEDVVVFQPQGWIADIGLGNGSSMMHYATGKQGRD